MPKQTARRGAPAYAALSRQFTIEMLGVGVRWDNSHAESWTHEGDERDTSRVDFGHGKV